MTNPDRKTIEVLSVFASSVGVEIIAVLSVGCLYAVIARWKRDWRWLTRKIRGNRGI